MDLWNEIVRPACLELSSVLAENLRNQFTVQKRQWCRNWLSKKDLGLSTSLVKELRAEDPKAFQKLLRMSPQSFDLLLSLIEPGITKETTNMREAIPAHTKLEITLHYLCTGATLLNLEHYFRVSDSAISSFIPEVLNEIDERLAPEHLHVSF